MGSWGEEGAVAPITPYKFAKNREKVGKYRAKYFE